MYTYRQYTMYGQRCTAIGLVTTSARDLHDLDANSASVACPAVNYAVL